MGDISIEELRAMYREDKRILDDYKTRNGTFAQIAERYGIDIDDLIEEFFETGDPLLATLVADRKMILGERVRNTLTMNGNYVPDDVYSHISHTAEEIINFKYNRYRLVKTIQDCWDDDLIALTPVDIVMLIINTGSRDKELLSRDDREQLNQLYERAMTDPVLMGGEAKAILGLVEAKRLSVDDNTALYDKYREYLNYLHKRRSDPGLGAFDFGMPLLPEDPE